MTNEKTQKNAGKFSCESCLFNCNKESDWQRHLSTSKHFKRTNTNEITPKNAASFFCECGNKYYHASSLWNHKKKCKNIASNNTQIIKIEYENDSDLIIDKELVMSILKQNSEIMKENSELKNMIIEVMKTGINNTTQNSHNNTITKTNSHNKTFNLQFFLNETCKDAMNITEFVNSIQLQLSDLERVGELGYVEGISNIITSNLKALDVTQRPIHCTDKKRETMYVKDEDKWEKEEEEKKKLRKVIKTVSSKNIQMLPNFVKAHPDCKHSDSKYSDQYGQIIIESMSNDKENEEKIIKKISEKVTVDKEGDQ